MKKTYKSPSCFVSNFDLQDIITSSGVISYERFGTTGEEISIEDLIDDISF